jgi:hypothetical protein
MSLDVRILAVSLGATLLTACTSIQPTFTSLGNPGYRINCGGVFGDGDLGSCYQSAGEICKGAGYRISQSGVSSMIVECRTDQLNNRVPTPEDPR